MQSAFVPTQAQPAQVYVPNSNAAQTQTAQGYIPVRTAVNGANQGQNQTYVPNLNVANQAQGETPSPAPVMVQPQVNHAQASMLVPQSYGAQQVQQLKPLTPAQIVFAITNSEIEKYRRFGNNVDAKQTIASYQQHYTGWTTDQLLQAAFQVVEIYDQSIQQWRLVRSYEELRLKQQQFSKRNSYFRSRRAAA
ncbi:MAG: hypothetical protein AAFQ80_07620 [Cyanobacteria bacterium J06621_8]